MNEYLQLAILACVAYPAGAFLGYLVTGLRKLPHR